MSLSNLKDVVAAKVDIPVTEFRLQSQGGEPRDGCTVQLLIKGQGGGRGSYRQAQQNEYRQREIARCQSQMLAAVAAVGAVGPGADKFLGVTGTSHAIAKKDRSSTDKKRHVVTHEEMRASIRLKTFVVLGWLTGERIEKIDIGHTVFGLCR